MESEIVYLKNHGFVFTVNSEVIYISHPEKKILNCTHEEEKRLDYLLAQDGYIINPEWE